MTEEKIGIKYWQDKWTKPTDMDLAAIEDAFKTGSLSDEQKELLAELLLTGRIRDDLEHSRGNDIATVMGIFNQNFAVDELFYWENENVATLWRYSFPDFVKAIPLQFVRVAIKRTYTRLGVDVDNDDIARIIDSGFIYSDFFELISETMGSSKFIMCDDPAGWNSFAFTAYFNMYKFFGVLGFNGYSPFQICSDIGTLCIPSSSWKFIALPKGAEEKIADLNSRARGRRYPTWQQNKFLGEIAKI